MNVIKTTKKEHSTLSSEQRPEEWWEKTVEMLDELLSGVERREVKGLGISGQMHGLVILDDADAVIRPAIIWNDGRAMEETEFLNNVIGKTTIAEHTMNIAFPGFTAPKLLWLKKHEPESFARIKKIMLPKDYLVYRLTGVFSTDASDASGTLLFDVKNRKWDEFMVNLCGVTMSQLPTVHESFETVGTVKSIAGLESCKVVAGAADNAGAAIGLKDGACNISLGTSATILIPTDVPIADPENRLHTFAHANGKYYMMGCMLSGAVCYSWFSKISSFDIEAIDRKKLGSNTVFFAPYLAGERCPYNDPEVRGSFIGLSHDTTKEDMFQAVLEGVAFGIRDSLEIVKECGIPITESTICGGGASSALWKEIMANVLNIEIQELSTDSDPAYGSAILASNSVSSPNTIKSVIMPDPCIVSRYNARYSEFKRIYKALKSLTV